MTPSELLETLANAMLIVVIAVVVVVLVALVWMIVKEPKSFEEEKPNGDEDV